MGWDAEATKNGKVIHDYRNRARGSRIVDPVLRAAFGTAVEELAQLTGHGDVYFLDGGLHGHGSLQVLQLATGEPCVRNYIAWGQLEWSEELIQRRSLTANWMIPRHSAHPDEYCWLPEAYEERDYWCVKLFWDVCVEHHLGILLSW